MDEQFFRRNYEELARKLLGQRVQIDGRWFFILGAKGFPKEENSGLYEPVTTMEPGAVFCPRYRNSCLLLVACLSEGQIGGCVLINAIQFDGSAPLNGAGRVTKALGIDTHELTGTLVPNGELLQLLLNGADPPPPVVLPTVKATGTISHAEIEKRMPLIIKVYLKRFKADATLKFETFLAECFAYASPRALGVMLNDAK